MNGKPPALPERLPEFDSSRSVGNRKSLVLPGTGRLDSSESVSGGIPTGIHLAAA